MRISTVRLLPEAKKLIYSVLLKGCRSELRTEVLRRGVLDRGDSVSGITLQGKALMGVER